MNRRSTFGYTTWDVEDRPLVVIWEATRACALACRHCRATAQRRPGPDELTTAEARSMLVQVARIQPQIFVITGGDPLERADLFDLIAFARELGLRVSLAPSVTPLLDRQAVARLRTLGCAGMQVSLDGADAATHDRFRGHPGTFARTLETCAWIREEGLPLTVGTTVARHNAEQLAEMYELVSGLDVVRWSLFFLVPTGRARAQDMIPPEYAEAVLVWLESISRDAPFMIKTTEAPQIRRVLASLPPDRNRSGALAAARTPGVAADRRGPAQAAPSEPAPIGGQPGGTRSTIADGRGFVFIAADGDICPSGFLPLAAGNARADDVLNVYRTHPLFRALRDPDALTGPRCRRCSYRYVCGGSRSRAYALSGDPLGDDPLCAYEPPTRVAETRDASC